jgi:hypothetical protein
MIKKVRKAARKREQALIKIQVGTVAHACNHSYSGSGGKRVMSLKLVWEKLGRSCLKNKVQKRTACMAQVI